MKISSVLICICLGAITSANNCERYQEHGRFLNPDAVILQTFEMLKWLIQNGSPDVLPVLDPFEFHHKTFEINVPNKLLMVNANFSNGILKGLGDFEVRKAEFIKNEIAIVLCIHFPLLTLEADHYEMKGNIYQAVPLAGYGLFEIQVTGFNFWTTIYLTQSEDGESVLIDKFNESDYTVDEISSRTEFDKNIDDIFNALIGDLLADNLTRFSQFILNKYTDAALETINPFLDQFESWRFIAAILCNKSS